MAELSLFASVEDVLIYWVVCSVGRNEIWSRIFFRKSFYPRVSEKSLKFLIESGSTSSLYSEKDLAIKFRQFLFVCLFIRFFFFFQVSQYRWIVHTILSTELSCTSSPGHLLGSQVRKGDDVIIIKYCARIDGAHSTCLIVSETSVECTKSRLVSG